MRWRDSGAMDSGALNLECEVRHAERRTSHGVQGEAIGSDAGRASASSQP